MLAELVERRRELQLQGNRPLGAAQQLLDLASRSWNHWRSARRAEAESRSRGGSTLLDEHQVVLISAGGLPDRPRRPWTQTPGTCAVIGALHWHPVQPGGRWSTNILAKLLNTIGLFVLESGCRRGCREPRSRREGCRSASRPRHSEPSTLFVASFQWAAGSYPIRVSQAGLIGPTWPHCRPLRYIRHRRPSRTSQDSSVILPATHLRAVGVIRIKPQAK